MAFAQNAAGLPEDAAPKYLNAPQKEEQKIEILSEESAEISKENSTEIPGNDKGICTKVGRFRDPDSCHSVISYKLQANFT